MLFNRLYCLGIMPFKHILKAVLLGSVVFFKGINSVLKFLHLRIISIYLIIAGILELVASLISTNNVVQISFVFGLGVLIFYWFVQLFRSCSKLAVQSEKVREENEQKKSQQNQEKLALVYPFEDEKHLGSDGKMYPIVSQCAEHKKYIMVEYEDRIDLYYRSIHGIEKFDTNYKN